MYRRCTSICCRCVPRARPAARHRPRTLRGAAGCVGRAAGDRVDLPARLHGLGCRVRLDRARAGMASPAARHGGVDRACRRHVRAAARAGAVAVLGAVAHAGPGARPRRNAGLRGDVDRLPVYGVAPALRPVERPFQRQLGRELPRAGRHRARDVGLVGASGRGPRARMWLARRHRLGAAVGAAADARVRVAHELVPRLA